MTDPQSIETWTLMGLIYRDMDDGDYRNALLLSERLFAIDTQSTAYRFLYAKSLYHNLDYHASYLVTKGSDSPACVNLFAQSCLQLGPLQDSTETKRQYWLEGVKALKKVLEKSDDTVYWGDGDLFSRLENIKEAIICYTDSLRLCPFKLSAFYKLCDLAPDTAAGLKALGMLPKDTFKPLDQPNLSRSHRAFPFSLSLEKEDIVFNDNLAQHNQLETNSWSLPAIRNDYRELSVDELKALVRNMPDPLDEDLLEKSDIETEKEDKIQYALMDIQKMKADEAYKSKHGLHKKAPVHTTQSATTTNDVLDEEDINEDEVNIEINPFYPAAHRSPSLSRRPPRIVSNLTEKERRREQEKQNQTEAVLTFFLPNKEDSDRFRQSSVKTLLAGMNKVLKVLRILANGYYCASIYRCKEAALTLQKLDTKQYDSARVLCILGTAYYHANDHDSARYFFRHAFSIAPWFCESVPLYSTCLWYLEKQKELNVLTFVMRHNKSHLFEAYIVAGNWNKLAGKSNEALHWFKKATEQDSTQFYGHTLLGYEEWEKHSFLQAKEHFSKALMANRRSYMAWYGMASAYIGMEQYQQAASYLSEAIRLNPHHPTMITTMADILFELKEYKSAKYYIEKAISIRPQNDYVKFLSDINQKIAGDFDLLED
ncbi:Cell division cycle protein 27 [Choanephora cucurbitarum]|uniref:Cell division cycle protein 27 n=1 Tax=Choanephora cucurbitarum TaxID=101091 RepID=A0A1C7N3Y0_9FUNG|nr:Cell division cycle protein 27 [Choanephora cucurbitarum]